MPRSLNACKAAHMKEIAVPGISTDLCWDWPHLVQILLPVEFKKDVQCSMSHGQEAN